MLPEAINKNKAMADLMLKNGFVYTVDKDRRHVEAMAICEDKIISTGSDRDVETIIGPETKATDLDGRMVLP